MVQTNEQEERVEKITSTWQWNQSKTHAAAHKQIILIKWLIPLTQIDDFDDCMVRPAFLLTEK